jgi:hypothetical protein
VSLTTATRAETTKLFSTSIWWILSIVLFVYVAFTAAALGFVYAAAATGSLPGNAPPVPEEGLAEVLYSTATSVGYVFPLLVGTLMVTAEFRHKTLTPTFLATPRRNRVLVAKLAVGALIGVVLGVIGIVAAVGTSAAVIAGFRLETGITSPDTWAMLGRMLLAYVLWTLIGVGIGALVRNQVGAIVGVLVFTQFVEPIGRTAAAFVDGLSDVTRFLPGAASDALVGASVLSASVPGGSSEALEWWAGGLVLLGYAVVFVVLGHLVSWRRDVS